MRPPAPPPGVGAAAAAGAAAVVCSAGEGGAEAWGRPRGTGKQAGSTSNRVRVALRHRSDGTGRYRSSPAYKMQPPMLHTCAILFTLSPSCLPSSCRPSWQAWWRAWLRAWPPPPPWWRSSSAPPAPPAERNTSAVARLGAGQGRCIILYRHTASHVAEPQKQAHNITKQILRPLLSHPPSWRCRPSWRCPPWLLRRASCPRSWRRSAASWPSSGWQASWRQVRRGRRRVPAQE